MGNISATEIILILIIALVVFGPRRLPQIGRTVGKSLREFRKASQDIRDEFRFSLDDDDEPPMVRSQPRVEPRDEPDPPPEPRTIGPEGQVPVAATKRPAPRKKAGSSTSRSAGTRTPTKTKSTTTTKPRRSSTATARKPEQPG